MTCLRLFAPLAPASAFRFPFKSDRKTLGDGERDDI